MKVEYLDHMGDDLTVVNAARVSFDKRKTELDSRDVKLLQYLAINKHWTPFAHPQLSLRIEAPIFVARQWFRSVVGVARNETSRRYVDTPPAFYEPDSWRARPHASIKQGSGGILNAELQEDIEVLTASLMADSQRLYERLMNEYNVAPEQARMILPQSMETQWIETGSLEYFARICKQRLDAHAQHEIRLLAKKVAAIVKDLFPTCWQVLV